MADQSLKYVNVVSTSMAGQSNQLYTYVVPLDSPAIVGDIYKIGFGRRKALGVVRELLSSKPNVKSIRELGVKIALPTPLPSYYLALADWMSEYYVSSPRAVWSCLLPTGLSAKSQLKIIKSDHLLEQINPLSPAQNKALKTIEGHSTSLLHGITGSGKTEVYLHDIAKMIEQGKSSIVLVPEIMLTTQLETRLTSHFDNVVVLHSGISPARRKQLWLECLERSELEPMVVLGPRSALFTPLHNLGLIIVDEEHEPSYKQEAAPRYEAQVVAAQIARLTKSRLILGSATPSLRSYHLSQLGRIGYAQLRERHESVLPQIQIVDMKSQPQTSISEELAQAITDNLKSKKQTLLFLNRRGSAQALICNSCGKTSLCPTCNVSMSYHADLGRLVCHYCNRTMLPVALCSHCGSSELRYIGDGTKKLESDIAERWPSARLSRIDRDNSSLKHLQATYRALQSGEIDLLLGTQMISRGLDIELLNLVGIIDADIGLHTPDYTASERTFQLLSQAAGRAGRRSTQGKVIIQTRNPTDFAITAAANNDFVQFFADETKTRREYSYPPFSYLLKLQYAHRSLSTADAEGKKYAHSLKQIGKIALLGPTPQYRRSTTGKYIVQLVVKSHSRKQLEEIARNTPSTWVIDLDPINLS